MRKSVIKFVPFVAVVTLLNYACSHKSGLPEIGTNDYREFCTAFYTGLAGLQSGEDVRANDDLTRATQLAPGEPSAWANLSVFQLRRQEFDSALKSAETASKLAPDNSRIEALLGQIQSKEGNISASSSHYGKAIELDHKNLKAIYALALETERQGSDAKAERVLESALTLQPENTGVLLEVARLSAKLGQDRRLKEALHALQAQSANWPDAAKKQIEAVQQQAAGASIGAAAIQVQFLRNILLRVPDYQRSMDKVRTPTTVVFDPFLKFLRLPSPASQPAAPDTLLQFHSESAVTPETNVTWIGAIALDDKSAESVVWADTNNLHVGTNVTLPLPAVARGSLPLHALAFADLNYDFKTDLVVATSGGVRMYRQIDPQHFTDVTSQAKLDAKTVNGSYTGAWALDVDLDGDLDVVLGVPHGEPVVLRNNGDGTFATIHPFKRVDGLLSFAAADVDGDGDPDVALIDGGGELVVFSNERLGEYRRRDLPEGARGQIRALAAADVDGDGLPDFVLLLNNFTVKKLSSELDGETWHLGQIASASSVSGPVALTVADLDNNGALDLIVGDQIFLSDGKQFAAIGSKIPGNVAAVADLNADGLLDLLSLSDGRGVELLNHGVKNYHWQIIRTRAANATGDQRINSFGIGGEVEVRADLLTQKQIITSPILHFGLGEHSAVDFARIVWPNGFVQAEFALKTDQVVLAQQRLKGSCPFLFAWNGKRMSFVKDTAPWSPALGLRINAQKVAGIYQTQEWFKIPGDELAPHDGYYDLRVTAEYWETFYIDHYSLLVVDHPKGTEIYSDERFAVPPPPLKLYATDEPKPFRHATDDTGHDVTEVVSRLDGHYLDNFGRGQYQGVTRDHWVELQLPDEAPRSRPLYLVAHGWMHPSDGTTNIAMSQNSAPPPQGLSIEVPARKGKWIEARKGLGFPAGRVKTVVLDLTGIFQPGAERRLRLRTNLEIYWDKLEWASGLDVNSFKTTHLELASADLESRGFSEMKQANISSPELPDYNILVANGQRWRDLQGYFTRYGDVRELLNKIDDRMVIANAGDELRLRFTALPPPPSGWLRDYVMIGDGWIKDGDYNSVFSKTVLPLPYHGMKNYTLAPKTLEEELAYRLHPSDWQTYHTRYITPENFVNGLWGKE